MASELSEGKGAGGLAPVSIPGEDPPAISRPRTPIAVAHGLAGRRGAFVCERCGISCRDAHDLRKHQARKRPCQPIPADLTGACPHCGEASFGGGAAPGTPGWGAALVDHCRRRCRGRSTPAPAAAELAAARAEAAAARAEATAARNDAAELRAEVAAIRAVVADIRAEVAELRATV